MFFVFIIAVLNLALGFALAVYMGRGYWHAGVVKTDDSGLQAAESYNTALNTEPISATQLNNLDLNQVNDKAYDSPETSEDYYSTTEDDSLVAKSVE
ncbi:MAG TPA: hypothetical protein VIH42_07820 [Thermoguttaceae bacterium]